MIRLNTYPYLRPSSARVTPEQWVLVGESELPLPAVLPQWDPNTDLLLRRKLSIDVKGLKSDCQLTAKDVLRVAVAWHSPGTSLRGSGSTIDLGESNSSVSVEMKIEGRQVSDRVLVQTHIVLASEGKSGDRLSPRLPGSLLWKDQFSTIVEGKAARFPTEVVDFQTKSWLPENAAWYLDWDPEDFHHSALGSLRLLVNLRNERVTTAVASMSPDAEGAAIVEAIRFDVARTMIMAALASDDFVWNPAAFSAGTVGAAIKNLIRSCFPDVQISGLRQARREDAQAFECQLQDRLRYFRKE